MPTISLAEYLHELNTVPIPFQPSTYYFEFLYREIQCDAFFLRLSRMEEGMELSEQEERDTESAERWWNTSSSLERILKYWDYLM